MAILDQIQETNDIKKIAPEDYIGLAAEIREFIMEHVSKTGGHLASNLGAVELTMALHLCLDFPKDKLIWDVGHQSYTHKILTGRKEGFEHLRQFKGMSGFPKPHESDADAFVAGHSSTSLSVAYGFAKARDLQGGDETIVAVIGDGALSGGMAYEALNNIGQQKSNLIIILNDNKMSISENVGGMSKYLSKIRVGDRYNEFKGEVEQALLSIPKVGLSVAKTVKRSKDSIKQLLVPGMLFEDMGITYVGPVDGHDIPQLVDTIESAKTKQRPILIHVVSKKGKGYPVAERHPEHFHGVTPFDIETGKALKKKEVATYTDVFAKKMIALGKDHPELVAVTAAMPDGTGLSAFAKEYPKRCFDVGIAEEHAVTFAAGMAAAGLHPVVAIYSSFLQRAYDQILHDVCIQKLPVIFAIDRSGLVGADGDTHQGIFDVSFLSSIPNMTIMAPKNRYEMSKMLDFAVNYDGPIAIKYPRGSAFYECKQLQSPLYYGKSEILYKGSRVALLPVGKMMENGLKAYHQLKEEGMDITLVNPRFIKPIDEELIRALTKDHNLIVTVEDTVYQGGYGQAIAAYLRANNLKCKITSLAIKDQFVEQGTVEELMHMLKIDAEAIYNTIKNYYKKKKQEK